MSKKFKHLGFGLEAIETQDGKLFKELTVLVQDTDFEDPGARGRFATQLSDLTFRSLGFNVQVDWTNDSGYYINFPMMSQHNAALPPWYSDFIDPSDEIRTIKKLTDKVAVIDLKTSKMSGLWASFTPKLALDPNLLAKKINTPEEVAAICLHEFGHYFTMCELMDRTVYTNVILGCVDKALKHGADVTKREMIIEVAGKAFDMDQTAITDLQKSTSDKVVTTVLLAKAAGRRRSANGNNYYDTATMEFLADQFAARHGAGVHVAQGLDKLYKHAGMGDWLRQSRGRSMLIDVLMTGASIAMIVLGVVAVFNGMIVGIFALFVGVILMIGLGADEVAVHNDANERVRRIKRDLIEQSKTMTDPAALKKLAEDVVILDGLAKEYTAPDYKNLLQRLAVFLFKDRRTEQDTLIFQRQLEALSANDLFVKSLEWQHL
jgi:hypothetical protein